MCEMFYWLLKWASLDSFFLSRFRFILPLSCFFIYTTILHQYFYPLHMIFWCKFCVYTERIYFVCSKSMYTPSFVPFERTQCLNFSLIFLLNKIMLFAHLRSRAISLQANLLQIISFILQKLSNEGGSGQGPAILIIYSSVVIIT